MQHFPSRDDSPSQNWAVQCFADGGCVLYVDHSVDGSLAALHGLPGESQPTHSQRWAPAATRATRRMVLLDQFLRYIHPALAAEPREFPAFRVTRVTTALSAGGLAERRN
jgi:hypothetical protein